MRKFKAILTRDIESETTKIEKGSIVMINIFPKKGFCHVKEIETGKTISKCKLDCYKKTN